jgi:ABC-2 type transport system permease protein
MRAYVAIVSARLSTLLHYRAAALAGVATQLFFGFVRVMIFHAFYASSSRPQPMSEQSVITYIWLGQSLFLLVLVGPDSDVAVLIRKGGVAYELTKPLDLYGLWFARALGGRTGALALRALPIFALGGTVLGMTGPPTLGAGVSFVVASLLAIALASALITIATISLLWTVSGEGVSRLLPPLVWIFSGITVPLPLLPERLQLVIAALPFRGLLDTPLRIYLGSLAGADRAVAIVHQVVWIFVLVLTGRMLLARGLRRLVIGGG